MKKRANMLLLMVFVLVTFVACNRSGNDTTPQSNPAEYLSSQTEHVANSKDTVENTKTDYITQSEGLKTWVGTYRFYDGSYMDPVLYDLTITEDGTGAKGTLTFQHQVDNVEPFATIEGQLVELSSENEVGFIAQSHSGELLDRDYQEGSMLFQLTREKYNRILTTWVDWVTYDEVMSDICFRYLYTRPMASEQVTVEKEDSEDFPATSPELMEVAKKYFLTYDHTLQTGESVLRIEAQYEILGRLFDENNKTSILDIERFTEIYELISDESAYDDVTEVYPQEIVEEVMSTYFGIDGIDLRDILDCYDASKKGYKPSMGGYGGGGGYDAIITDIEESGDYLTFFYDVYFGHMNIPNTKYLSSKGKIVIKVFSDGSFEYVSNERSMDYPIDDAF